MEDYEIVIVIISFAICIGCLVGFIKTMLREVE